MRMMNLLDFCWNIKYNFLFPVKFKMASGKNEKKKMEKICENYYVFTVNL